MHTTLFTPVKGTFFCDDRWAVVPCCDRSSSAVTNYKQRQWIRSFSLENSSSSVGKWRNWP